MKINSKNLIIAGLIACLLILGFVRDFVFVNINYALGYVSSKSTEFWGHSSMDFLCNYGVNGLNTSKWVLTAAFTLLFLLLSLMIIRMIYNNRQFLKWFMLLYAIIFTVAGILYVFGWVVGHAEIGYTLSRVFIGFLQSPFPLMLFLPSVLLLKK